MDNDSKPKGNTIPVGGFKPEQAWVVVGMERQASSKVGGIQLPAKRVIPRESTDAALDELLVRWLND